LAVAKKRKSRKNSDEAIEDRPEKSATRVTVARKGDIEWSEIGSTAKARETTTETANLDVEDEGDEGIDTLGFGLDPSEDDDAEPDDEEDTEPEPRGAFILDRYGRRMPTLRRGQYARQSLPVSPYPPPDRKPAAPPPPIEPFEVCGRKFKLAPVRGAKGGLIERPKRTKRPVAQRAPSPWPRLPKVKTKLLPRYDRSDERKRTLELLQIYRQHEQEHIIQKIPESATSARRGRKGTYGDAGRAGTDAERKRRQRQREKQENESDRHTD
jgi:hypothetical protein